MSRILLIEDDPSTQVLLRNRLEDLEHEVVVESTGARGLMEARKGSFDLFLVDVGLGSGIDGYEVCRRLRAMPQFRKVPVVLVSGQVKNREELHRGYEAGCEAYLVKGDVSLLEDVVRAMLRLKSLQDDLGLQNRLLEEQNRRLQEERRRGAELESALRASGKADPFLREMAVGGPDGVMLVDAEGIVRANDRCANDLLGLDLIGRNLGSIAPDTGLEAFVRDARSDARSGFRLDVGRRGGSAPRTVSVSVQPLVRASAGGGVQRVVLLFDAAKRRAGAELLRLDDEGVARRELGPLLEAAREVFRPLRFEGESEAAAEVRRALAELATSERPVLLCGEPGTGKGLAARILHYAGRCGGPFLPVDCVAIAPENIERELFGSASTGGGTADLGLLERAASGTVCLREIGRLPRAVQRRLVEFLGTGELVRTGDTRGTPVTVRVVGATSEDPAELVAKGRLEPALAERFAQATLALPRLRDRPEDVPILARTLLERRSCGAAPPVLDPAALDALKRHDWPGNVRELETVLEVVARPGSARITPAELPSSLAEVAGVRRGRELAVAGRGVRAHLGAAVASPAWELPPEDDEPVSLKLYEKRALVRALRECGGDKLAAARLLKIGKSTFYRKLHEHEIA